MHWGVPSANRPSARRERPASARDAGHSSVSRTQWQVARALPHWKKLSGFAARHAVHCCWQVRTGCATCAAHEVSAVAHAVTPAAVVASSAQLAAVSAQVTTAATGRLGMVTPRLPATQVAPVWPQAVTAAGVVAAVMQLFSV